MKRHLNSTLLYVLLTIAAALILYPVIYTFFMAVMSPEEASAYPPSFLPHSFHLANFTEVFEIVPIAAFIGNTFLISGLTMIGQLITASLAAYAFAKMEFKGKKLHFQHVCSDDDDPLGSDHYSELPDGTKLELA